MGHLVLVGKWAVGHKGKRVGKERKTGEAEGRQGEQQGNTIIHFRAKRIFNLVTVRLDHLCHMAWIWGHIGAKLLDNTE